MSAPWDAFAHDPRRPEVAHLRVSDRDRAVVTDVLATAYADGRLSREEFDQRTTRVNEPQTLADLPPLIDDLVAPTDVPATVSPATRREAAERQYRNELRGSLVSFLIPTLICWTIWFAAGMSFPWPIFVTIGTGMGALNLLLNKDDRIRQIEKRAVRREERDRRRLDRHGPDERRELGPGKDS